MICPASGTVILASRRRPKVLRRLGQIITRRDGGPSVARTRFLQKVAPRFKTNSELTGDEDARLAG